jgi:hypothetical protein
VRERLPEDKTGCTKQNDNVGPSDSSTQVGLCAYTIWMSMKAA